MGGAVVVGAPLVGLVLEVGSVGVAVALSLEVLLWLGVGLVVVAVAVGDGAGDGVNSGTESSTRPTVVPPPDPPPVRLDSGRPLSTSNTVTAAKATANVAATATATVRQGRQPGRVRWLAASAGVGAGRGGSIACPFEPAPPGPAVSSAVVGAWVWLVDPRAGRTTTVRTWVAVRPRNWAYALEPTEPTTLPTAAPMMVPLTPRREPINAAVIAASAPAATWRRSTRGRSSPVPPLVVSSLVEGMSPLVGFTRCGAQASALEPKMLELVGGATPFRADHNDADAPSRHAASLAAWRSAAHLLTPLLELPARRPRTWID